MKKINVFDILAVAFFITFVLTVFNRPFIDSPGYPLYIQQCNNYILMFIIVITGSILLGAIKEIKNRNT